MKTSSINVRYFILLYFVFQIFEGFSQDLPQIRVHGLEAVNTDGLEKRANFNNYIKASKQIKLELMEQGYLACSIDSVSKDDSLKSADIYFFLGEKLRINNLNYDSLSKFAIEEREGVDFWNRKMENSPKKIVALIEKVLDYYENNGYPFAQVKLDSLKWYASNLETSIVTDLGPKVLFADIVIKSDSEIDKSLITKLVGLRTGDLFSIRKIDDIDIRIKEIPYYQLTAPTEYEFVNGKCNVYVYLKEKNANSFNAILGILPSDNGSLNITGDVRIKLLNALKKGEQIDFNWRKLLPLTQNLNVNFNYPYLFKSAFGISTRFDLYKKDTSYLDLNTRLGLVYAISSKMEMNIFFNNKSSSLLSTEKYQYVTTLPIFADVRANIYGFSLKYNNLNYRFNPTKGWDITLESGVGDKLIKKNAALNPELYDGITLKSLQFVLNGKIDKFFKFGKRSTVLLGMQGGILLSELIFENELYRLGGQRTLRGFDDESIFASSFVLNTLEYRFILEENSNLFVFGQGMYYDRQVLNQSLYDIPYSFGLGINFQTKPGIFSVSYSLGSQLNNPILLRSAKIHFGFVNYF